MLCCEGEWVEVALYIETKLVTLGAACIFV